MKRHSGSNKTQNLDERGYEEVGCMLGAEKESRYLQSSLQDPMLRPEARK